MNSYIDCLESFYSTNHEKQASKTKPKDNDRTIGIISLILIIAFAAYIIWTIIDAYAYGESDFVLEAKVNEASLGLHVTRFEIRGESDKQICVSGQCTINLEGYTYFSAPTPDSMGISYTVDFKVQDNQTNPNLGAKKKEFLEQFSASMSYCKVDDIIEENGQELYYCHDTSNAIYRKFDSKSWNYDTTGIYDAKNHTLKVTGNLTGGSSYTLNTTNELNTTEVTKNGGESEKPRTFMDCYTGFSSWGLLANMFTPADIDLTNPELKGLFSNMCNFIHDESGKWMNIWDVGEREILANEVNFTNFVPKYYPQGVPESLNKTFSQFGENFESGTNTTSVQ